MDMLEDFFYVVAVYIAGIVTALLSLWFLLTSEENYLLLSSATKKHDKPTDSKLPESISDCIKNQETYRKRETCLSLNLILQFFFQEKQNDTEIRIWLTELISQEFSDLLKHRALSKIINKMEIQDLNLGHNFPVIKAATPINIQFVKKSTLLKKVEINVEIEYTGGFQLAIDAITKLSKKAVVKIKVVRLSGNGCLEFNRYPYTHWSFSFYEEPEVEFEVVSTVLGRHIPRFKSIIINQLKLLINKKHTLPHYKLRGPPLISRRFMSPYSFSSITEDCGAEIPGFLFLTLVKCTRLQPALVGTNLYFSLTLSEIPLVCAYETPVGIWVTLDLTVKRTLSTPFGILLRTADDNSQIIETVSSKSAAYQAGLRKNDIVLSVNDVCLVSGSQAAKLFSATSSDSSKVRSGTNPQEMVIRIKRLVYTDHKRTSLENKNLFESNSILADTGSIFSLSSSPQSVPVFSDDDLSFESASMFGDTSEKTKQSRPISIHGDKVSFSLSNCDKQNHIGEPEGGISSLCSSVSSCGSSSPDLRSKLFNVSTLVTDLSPIHSCDEETLKTFEEKVKFSSSISPGCENALELSSTPIQIPCGNDKSNSSELCQEKQSISAQSSRAGTPTSQTFEFVPLMVPPGMPIIKMDVKNMPKKVAGKNNVVFKHFETAPVEGNCEPILGNDFEFLVDAESKFVNICVWSKNLPPDPLEADKTLSFSDKDEKNNSANYVINRLRKKDSKEMFKESDRNISKDLCRQSNIDQNTAVTGHPDHILVGYANLVIKDTVCQAALNTQGYVTKIISLQPANSNCPELSEHPLLQHTGFDPKLCYGDVMLAITHQPKNKTCLNKIIDRSSSNVPASEDESPTDTTQSDDEDFEINQDQKEERDHDFKRTHFNAATHCNFCKKKIWLKDAYQCSECGIICHKKCMLRCEQATVCDFGGLRYREIRDSSIKPDGKSDLDMPEIITTSAAMDSPLLKMSKKSPPVTPQVSLSGNPFLADNDNEESRLEAMLDALMNYPHDERHLTMARESAVHLYSQLSPQERLDKIKQELEILQHRVDNEGKTRKDLAHQEKMTSDKSDPLKKTKLSLLISECDARTQALAQLTLHYFTALQMAQKTGSETVVPLQA